ncbi:MAG: rod shape-determining protein MreC [Thermoleophilaceae bacterium]
MGSWAPSRGRADGLCPAGEGRRPGAQARPRPVRLGRGHLRRQGGEQAAAGRGRGSAKAAGRVRHRPARRRAAARAWSSSTATRAFPTDTKPVAARVIVRSPTVWYSTVKIDRGSDDGIKKDQPVISAGGLAGKVSSVSGGSADVTLITDGASAVSAQVMPDGANGIVKPEVGKPDDLLLDFVEKKRRVTEGTTVVTSGFRSSRVESLFPRGIPIGRVTKVDLDEVELYQRVHLKPFADLRRVDFVQVLTSRGRTATEQAGVPAP